LKIWLIGIELSIELTVSLSCFIAINSEHQCTLYKTRAVHDGNSSLISFSKLLFFWNCG